MLLCSEVSVFCSSVSHLSSLLQWLADGMLTHPCFHENRQLSSICRVTFHIPLRVQEQFTNNLPSFVTLWACSHKEITFKVMRMVLVKAAWTKLYYFTLSKNLLG